jgi:hypothetical protein
MTILRRTFLHATAAAVMVLLPAVASAQDAPATPAACTYDTCALRVQAPSFTSPLQIVRGLEGAEVVTLGLLQPEVAPFLALSDSAVAHARVYDVQFDRGTLISYAGTAIAIVAPILLEGTMQKIAFTGVGIGLSVYGGMLINQANDALNRALWWYNRELAIRSPPQ